MGLRRVVRRTKHRIVIVAEILRHPLTPWYVRVVANLTGTHTNGTPIGVAALRGHPHIAPVNE